MLLAVRASPSSKVATLNKDSLVMVHGVRTALDERPSMGDAEVCPAPIVKYVLAIEAHRCNLA